MQKSRRLCTSSKQKGKVHSAPPIRKEEGGVKPAAHATAAEQNEPISHYEKKTRAAGTQILIRFAFANRTDEPTVICNLFFENDGTASE